MLEKGIKIALKPALSLTFALTQEFTEAGIIQDQKYQELFAKHMISNVSNQIQKESFHILFEALNFHNIEL